MAKLTFMEKLRKLFGIKSKYDEEFFEELGDTLIESDIGAKLAFDIVDQLEEECKKEKIFDENLIVQKLKELLSPCVLQTRLEPAKDKVNVYLVLGVNGVGKTTSVAKMAGWYAEKYFGSKDDVIMAASDTFRAAAIDQLKFHGEKTGIRVVAHQDGSDPSAVVFDAIQAMSSKGKGLVLADTAGRLHNKENLVKELQKIDRTISQKVDKECYKKILVLDATTGQNGLRQAEVFNDAVGLDAVILTKFDSTAKGGMVVTLGKELGIPVAFVCFGEKYPDIDVFDSEKYMKELLG
ncbi:MAG: signal recognition particle-docking protein FtsY [Treponemataceae bacterium]|nr:signal recognition particle-docking protein FtsY [Spirochaetales bacterium]MDY6030395.1 signal recognition particle-docking protein FtsY [Treponemataceae bacterium]